MHGVRNLGVHAQEAPITFATTIVAGSVLLLQEALKGQIRRNCLAAKEQKLKGFKLPPVVVAKLIVNEQCEELIKESIEALQHLLNGRASVPSASLLMKQGHTEMCGYGKQSQFTPLLKSINHSGCKKA